MNPTPSQPERPEHNPDGLTPEQVGEGWQLLTRAEIEANQGGDETTEIEKWEFGAWDSTGWTGDSIAYTYRRRVATRTPAPEAVAGKRKHWRKKPVVIEAIQWTGVNEGVMRAFCSKIEGPWEDVSRTGDAKPYLYLHIPTSEGVMRADMGDWIIKGVKGEFYPCKPDIFAATYEPVDSAPTPPADKDAENDEHCQILGVMYRIPFNGSDAYFYTEKAYRKLQSELTTARATIAERDKRIETLEISIEAMLGLVKSGIPRTGSLAKAIIRDANAALAHAAEVKEQA